MRRYHLKGHSATDKMFTGSHLFIGIEIFNNYQKVIFNKHLKKKSNVATSN